MTKTISVAGVEVEVSTPYAAGHVLTEAEAKSLNQTRAENIGNSFRKALDAANKGVEGAEPLASVLEKLRAYDATYAFSLSSSTGTRASMTPLERESRRVAKEWLVAKLKSLGKTLKSYTEANGEDFVKDKIAEIATTDSIQSQAKKNIANAQKNAEAIDVAV